jgi:hypothetical protein
MPVTTQVARVKVRGPLVECADGFEAELQRLSYGLLRGYRTAELMISSTLPLPADANHSGPR